MATSPAGAASGAAIGSGPAGPAGTGVGVAVGSLVPALASTPASAPAGSLVPALACSAPAVASLARAAGFAGRRATVAADLGVAVAAAGDVFFGLRGGLSWPAGRSVVSASGPAVGALAEAAVVGSAIDLDDRLPPPLAESPGVDPVAVDPVDVDPVGVTWAEPDEDADGLLTRFATLAGEAGGVWSGVARRGCLRRAFVVGSSMVAERISSCAFDQSVGRLARLIRVGQDAERVAPPEIDSSADAPGDVGRRPLCPTGRRPCILDRRRTAPTARPGGFA
ncbi:MAG TPA: hypothetical protein VF163_10530 [Micromonosporaceae bacterium]